MYRGVIGIIGISPLRTWRNYGTLCAGQWNREAPRRGVWDSAGVEPDSLRAEPVGARGGAWESYRSE